MEDCDKYKKKFYFGIFIWIITFLFEVSKIFYLNLVIELILVLVIGIYGSLLVIPYLKCLSQFKRRLK